ncbi:MAG: hypothetical protein HY303_06170, partial [Candidatus Wallbacteria bacterium]|nr:hypothetical protein [Candidatus Wallbacteria bacterium]
MRLKTMAIAGLLLAGRCAAPAAAEAAGGVQEGALAVRVPSGAAVKAIEVYLDVEGSAAREEQVAADSDSLLTVGRVRETLVDQVSGKVE